MKKLLIASTSLVVLFQIGGCAQVPLAAIPARQIETQRITLGNVQQVVKKGAANSDVIAALSSPNIITTNSDGTETWVYDKISSEAEVVGGPGFGGSAAVAVKSSRTMIVVIKFDKNSKVDTVSYRQTSY